MGAHWRLRPPRLMPNRSLFLFYRLPLSRKTNHSLRQFLPNVSLRTFSIRKNLSKNSKYSNNSHMDRRTYEFPPPIEIEKSRLEKTLTCGKACLGQQIADGTISKFPTCRVR
ncbi:hypothetical protein CEXT_358481 [Caerostris extrusa]|uniref:Uncharacterized protein n=1 Tax=Caerostris extrusa TaxID=172846 RepID=A0AAV4TV95_CAEEX|nr:hypothetical protein CEXT_358481 [Caerostris extrusa]